MFYWFPGDNTLLSCAAIKFLVLCNGLPFSLLPNQKRGEMMWYSSL